MHLGKNHLGVFMAVGSSGKRKQENKTAGKVISLSPEKKYRGNSKILLWALFAL